MNKTAEVTRLDNENQRLKHQIASQELALKHWRKRVDEQSATLRTERERRERAESAYFSTVATVDQTLGRALGYPRYCDDQKNFPGTTDADGVCTGDHVAETLASEAAKRIEQHAREVERLRERVIAGANFYAYHWYADGSDRIGEAAWAFEPPSEGLRSVLTPSEGTARVSATPPTEGTPAEVSDPKKAWRDCVKAEVAEGIYDADATQETKL